MEKLIIGLDVYKTMINLWIVRATTNEKGLQANTQFWYDACRKV